MYRESRYRQVPCDFRRTAARLRPLIPDQRGRVSNPDLSGSYWQDQDDADYGAGGVPGRTARGAADSPWDDGGFWRDRDRSGRIAATRRAGGAERAGPDAGSRPNVPLAGTHG